MQQDWLERFVGGTMLILCLKLNVGYQIIKRISCIVISPLKGGKSPLISSLLRLEREERSHCHGTRRMNDSTLVQKPTTNTKFNENAFLTVKSWDQFSSAPY
jgi:hypothetical protein